MATRRRWKRSPDASRVVEEVAAIDVRDLRGPMIHRGGQGDWLQSTA